MSVRDRRRINGEKGAMLATSLGGEAAGGDGVAANIGDGGAGEEATEASSVAGTGEGDGGGGIDAGTTSAAGAEANQASSEAGTGEGDGGAAGEDAGMTSAAGAEANEASSEAGTVEGDGGAAGEDAHYHHRASYTKHFHPWCGVGPRRIPLPSPRTYCCCLCCCTFYCHDKKNKVTNYEYSNNGLNTKHARSATLNSRPLHIRESLPIGSASNMLVLAVDRYLRQDILLLPILLLQPRHCCY